MLAKRLASTAAAGVLLVLLALPGCSQDGRILSGLGQLSIRSDVATTAPSRYESAAYALRGLKLLPVDPDTETQLGGEVIDLIGASDPPIDLRGTAQITVAANSVPPGTYRVELLEWAIPRLVDQNPPSGEPRCVDNIGVIPPQSLALPPPPPIGGFNPPILVTVPSGGVTRIVLTIDGAALIQGFEDAFECRTSGFCGADPAPCLASFNVGAFFPALRDHATVSVQ